MNDNLSNESNSYTWDRNTTHILIMAYETQPNLYQTHDPNYKLKNRRLDSLEAIKTVLFENGYDVPLKEINKKIHGLRTQFFKEYGKVKRGLVSGTGTDDIYTSKLWCYEHLKFLINSNPIRLSQSNLDNFESISATRENQACTEHAKENIQPESECELIYEGEVGKLQEDFIPNQRTNTAQVSKTTKKCGKRNALETEATSLIKNASSILNNYSNRSQADDLSVFGR